MVKMCSYKPFYFLRFRDERINSKHTLKRFTEMFCNLLYYCVSQKEIGNRREMGLI